MKAIDIYGDLAKRGAGITTVAGRYKCQELGQREIVSNVIDKLDLKASDTLLEIGCNSGQLLIPLSFHVEKVIGVDHPDLIKLLMERAKLDNFVPVPGDFLEVDLDQLPQVDKILIYSVIHCLRSEGEVIEFMNRALGLLNAGGVLLIGDLVNVDRKKRFQNSEAGRLFSKEWDENKSQEGDELDQVSRHETSTVWCDDLILRLLGAARQQGFHSYLVPQPISLPFGHTREDLVIVKPY